VIVAPAVASRLRSLGVEAFRPVVASESGEPLPFEQLLPQKVLPPFSPRSSGFEREDQCRTCGRDGFFDVPHVLLALRYDKLPEDFFQSHVWSTWEHFGNSRLRKPFRESVFAAPKLVVSDEVAKILLKADRRGVEFVDVEIG
jgi:hypothetical protein